MRILRLCLAGILALAALVGTAHAGELPFPALTGRVVDAAHILKPETVRQLEGELAVFEQKTGGQIVVATVPSLGGSSIEDYGYQLGRAWQIGRKDVNDGAILIIAPNERAVRIEVGYGFEGTLTDALSFAIIQRDILPAIKSGDMDKGVLDGAGAMLKILGKDPFETASLKNYKEPGDNVGIALSVAVGFFIALVAFNIFFPNSPVTLLLNAILLSAGRGGGKGGGFSGGGGSFGGGGASGKW